MKGFVLAAGFGTRLRPLTERWPKPLVPFAGTTPLTLALWRLGEAGITAIAINSHHHPSQVAAFVQSNPLGQTLKLSHEPEILGTGGCYNPLRAWVGDDELAVLNGDVVSTIDVAKLALRHRESRAVATMALLPVVIPGESAVYHAGGRVLGFGKTPPPAAAAAGNFACVQILSPRFLELLPKSGAFDVISAGYQVALNQGLTIACHLHDGIWHDLRSPAFVWLALKDLLATPDGLRAVGLEACRNKAGLATRLSGRVLVDERSTVAPTARLSGHVVIEPGCRIEAAAVVEDAWLLPGAVVAAGETVTGRIVGPGLDIALA